MFATLSLAILAVVALSGFFATAIRVSDRRYADSVHQTIMESWVATRAVNVDWATSARMAASLDRR